MEEQIGSGLYTFNKTQNVQQQKNIFFYSIFFFIGVILLSILITFGIHLYNKKSRNIQTPFFTGPYISLLIEIFSIIVLLSAGIYFLIFY